MTAKAKVSVRGLGRTTRADWINAALDTLINEGVEQVKVITLAKKLDCARSSFYWYFKDRSDLLDALIDYWASTNTKAIIGASSTPAKTINLSLAALYAGWVSGDTFHTTLDFAIRDWARRSGTVRRALDISDSARLDAISAMFRRHGFAEKEADTRARVVYFTQIGYAAVDQRESWETRMSRSREYLYCMTGIVPNESEVALLMNASRRKI